MGEKIATSTFTLENFAAFNARLYAQARIACARIMDPDDPWNQAKMECLGAEKEHVMIRPRTGALAHVAADLLEHFAKNDPIFQSELGPWNIELGFRPVPIWEGNPFTQLMEQELTYLARLQMLITARGYDAMIGSFGVPPSITEADISSIMMEPRYEALMAGFDRIYGPYSFPLGAPGFDQMQMSGSGVALEAATTTAQIHRDVTGTELANRLNTRRWISPVLVGLTGFGGHAFGRLFCSGDLRHLIFPHVVRNRGLRFDQGWILDPRVAIMRALFEGVMIPRVTGEPDRELRELRLHLGTTYPPTGRVVITPTGLRVEGRDRAAGATACDTASDHALELALELLEGPKMQERVNDGLDFQMAQSNLVSAARFGANAPITMLNARNRPYDTTPAQFVRDHAGSLYRALVGQRIDPTEAELHLGPAIRRAELNFTPTSWLIQAASRLPADNRLGLLTLEAVARSQTNEPVHLWDLP